MDFSSNLTLLTEAAEDYRSRVLKVLENSLKKFIDKYPDVVVGWTQSTEKDKEEGIWEFAVNDFQVFTSEQELANFDGYTTSYYSYENFLIDYPHLGEDFWDDWVALESFLAKVPAQNFKDLFGSDAKILFSSEGFQVESINHD
jgi:hypothetical protein